MKRKILIGSLIAGFLAIFFYFSIHQILPEEIDNAPEWMPLDHAMAEANESEKLILIDIYEVGCRFCRQMEREVYPSETIRTLIDRSYHPVKIDGNSDKMITYKGEPLTEREFAAQMGVTAFPFTVVLDAEGNVIDKRRGYMGTMDLSRFLNNALSSGVAES
ncbi:MAG: thioredoxin fold domain-containing protein [Balneolaceae bacterium]